MKFELYTATDKRDNTPAYWLLDLENDRVAQYHIKTAPTRVKHQSLSPDSIVWGYNGEWSAHADIPTAKLIDSWDWAL